MAFDVDNVQRHELVNFNRAWRYIRVIIIITYKSTQNHLEAILCIDRMLDPQNHPEAILCIDRMLDPQKSS